MEDNLIFILLLFPIIGIGLCIAGIMYRRRLKEKSASCLPVQGSVVDNVGRASRASSGAGATIYHPVVAYTVGEQVYTVQGSVGYGRKKKEGSEAKVLYDPHEPSTAYLAKDYYYASNMLTGIGGMMTFLGSLMCYHLLR